MLAFTLSGLCSALQAHHSSPTRPSSVPQFCKAKLSCPIAADLLPEDAAAAGRRYAERLASAHDAACPWRAATSAPSLLQFPPLPKVRAALAAAAAELKRVRWRAVVLCFTGTQLGSDRRSTMPSQRPGHPAARLHLWLARPQPSLRLLAPPPLPAGGGQARL